MRKLILLYILLSSVSTYAAQADYEPIVSNGSSLNKLFYKNRRAKYPLGINLIAFGPSGAAGVSLDWFIKPKVNFEFGVGLIDLKSFNPSYFAGLKYHIFGNTVSNSTPYLGFFDRVSIDSSRVSHQIYIPIGLQIIKKSKLTWNFELAYNYNLQSYKSHFGGAIKMGYRFNRIRKK